VEGPACSVMTSSDRFRRSVGASSVDFQSVGHPANRIMPSEVIFTVWRLVSAPLAHLGINRSRKPVKLNVLGRMTA
jgi:hypothetical protein